MTKWCANMRVMMFLEISPQTGKCSAIVSFNHFDIKCIAAKIFGKYSFEQLKKKHTRDGEKDSINCWNSVYGGEKIALFRYFSLVQSSNVKYDKYAQRALGGWLRVNIWIAHTHTHTHT